MNYPYGQQPQQPVHPSPELGHLPPGQGYSAPGQGFPFPGPGYAPPGQSFPAQGQSYSAPEQGFPAPAYPAVPNPYGYPRPTSSGGTGVTAGILALLGSLACVALSFPHLFVAPVLLVGGIMLLKRNNVGRITVIVACVAFIVLTVVLGRGLLPLIADLFAALTLVLAAVGSTKQWIEAARPPVVPGGYPPVPYYY